MSDADAQEDGEIAHSTDGTERGMAFRCRNGDCDLMEPRTTVHESERKTLYRCPGCSRVLHADWKDKIEEDGDDSGPDHKPASSLRDNESVLGGDLEI